eukprot:CAMPEP_0171063750 /NCGR_PEP_ID=MMETSP0766_2-20121228/5860_1 /TAXON_ID=439317 /ORGANISM="Gambierdiscus australes, Strain CAWD 149" /LENGTH=98 /DNA_ID=CAMNT_0011519699 /DNA_START=215 /DNA_END=511 /DNA_ORIENTATION=+
MKAWSPSMCSPLLPSAGSTAEPLTEAEVGGLEVDWPDGRFTAAISGLITRGPTAAAVAQSGVVACIWAQLGGVCSIATAGGCGGGVQPAGPVGTAATG